MRKGGPKGEEGGYEEGEGLVRLKSFCGSTCLKVKSQRW